MNLSQKLSGFAKTFRSALLTRWRGFCDSEEGYVPLLRTNSKKYFLTHCLPMGSTQTFYQTKYQAKAVSITSLCWRLDSVASELSHFVISKCSLYDEPSNWFECKGQQKPWDILFRDGQLDFYRTRVRSLAMLVTNWLTNWLRNV